MSRQSPTPFQEPLATSLFPRTEPRGGLPGEMGTTPGPLGRSEDTAVPATGAQVAVILRPGGQSPGWERDAGVKSSTSLGSCPEHSLGGSQMARRQCLLGIGCLGELPPSVMWQGHSRWALQDSCPGTFGSKDLGPGGTPLSTSPPSSPHSLDPSCPHSSRLS